MKDDLQLLIKIWLSEEEHESCDRLLERLQNEPEFRAAFADEVAMLGKLKAVNAGEPRLAMLEELLNSTVNRQSNFDENIFKTLEKESKQKKIIQFAIAIAAVLMICFMIFRPGVSLSSVQMNSLADKPKLKTPAQTNLNPEAMMNISDVIAVIKSSSEAQWSNSKFDHLKVIKREGVHLLKGKALLDFMSGVSLTMSAGTKINIIDKKEIFLEKGKISCQVNEFGKGFIVRTKEAEILDIGTSFQVDASLESTKMLVLDGEVKVKPASSKEYTSILTDKAIEVSDGIISNSSNNESLTFTIQEFEGLREKNKQQQYQIWLTQNERIKTDPETLFHLAKMNKPMRLIKSDISGKSIQAVFPFGVTKGLGRWQQNGAIHFSKFYDRLMVRLPHTRKNFTLLSWIKLDQLNLNQALMTFEGQSRWTQNASIKEERSEKIKEGDFHAMRWHINDRGAIRLAIAYIGKVKSEQQWHNFMTKPKLILPKHLGEWLCVGVTYDFNNKSVTHYLNGEAIGKNLIINQFPVKMDFLEIGNLTNPSDTRKERSFQFKGSTDEMLISERPFSATEMINYYNNSKPE
jgi:hypothetical protein